MAKYDDTDGVWRTIGGRRVFIKTGQSLSDAMKESGKFGTKKKTETEDEKAKKLNETMDKRQEIIKKLDDETKDLDNYDKYNLAVSKLEQSTDMQPTEKQYWAGVKERYEKEAKSSNNPIEKMANDRIKEKENTLNNDKILLDGMKKKGLNEINGTTQKDLENRIKKNENYLKTANNSDSKESYQDYVKRTLENDDYLRENRPNEYYKKMLNENKDASYEITSDDPNRFGDKIKKVNDFNKKEEEASAKRVQERFEKEQASKNNTNYRDQITNAAKNSTEDNVTLDVETGKAVSFDKGYSVSFQQSSDSYSDEEYHAKVEECRNKCDGKVYAGKYGGDAEASFHTDSLEDAKEIMYKYNQESIYDWKHETLIMNDKYDASKNQTNYKEEKSTNQIMNEKIRTKASKKPKEDLPKKVEIKNQGTSNRKEVSENIQAHILDYYDSPQDFIDQMDNMHAPTNWHAGEQLAKGGSYMIYYDEQREFLDSLKINPKGKEFSDDKVFSTYTSLIGRESSKLYDRLQRNSYKKYLKEHPGSKMSFSEYKDMKKGGR